MIVTDFGLNRTRLIGRLPLLLMIRRPWPVSRLRYSFTLTLNCAASAHSSIASPMAVGDFRSWSLALLRRAALGPWSHLQPGPTRSCSVGPFVTSLSLSFVARSALGCVQLDRKSPTAIGLFYRSSSLGPGWVTHILSPGSRRADTVTGGRGHRDVPERQSDSGREYCRPPQHRIGEGTRRAADSGKGYE